MSIFKELNYKEIIKTIMKQRKISLKDLAESAGVQPPYLSRVLRHDDHINNEQLFLISRRLDIKGDVFEYLGLLLEHDRAGNHHYQKYVASQIESFRNEKLKLESRIKDTGMVTRKLEFEQANFVSYYIDPTLQIVHMAMMIPRFSSSPKLLASSLRLDVSEVMAALKKLQHLNLLRYENEIWQTTDNFLHLDKNDVLSEQNHLNWRIHAMQFSKPKTGNKYAYTATMCASSQFFRNSEERIKSVVTEMSKEAIDADSEHVYQVNFDLIALV